MRKHPTLHRLAWTAAVWANLAFVVSDAAARGPSMGRAGGGGARPGGGMSRPAGGGMSRPGGMGGGGMARPAGGMGGGGMARPAGGGGMARPSMPSPNRPSLGNVGGGSPGAYRPSLPTASRPSLGGVGGGIGGGGSGAGFNRPGAGNLARPSLPSTGTRPNIQPPGAQNPISRPSLGGGGGFDRPNLGGDRPSLGNVNRPQTLPGVIDRPGLGGGGIGGGGERPGGGIGANRPGGVTRPDRPIIGGGGDRPNRPGGGNNNIVIGGGNNIIGGGNNIGSGNWGLGNRPGGWSQNHNWDQWHDNWHNHCINNHHNWYHGCWNNHWGAYWYAPVAWGAVGWGLGSWYSSAAYYNPYYTASTAMPYDYSQPVVVNNYVAADATAPATAAQQPAPPQNDAALKQFDQGLADFKAGNYRQAIARFDAALKQLPGDPVVHEVRALAQFAVGDYKNAAAGLNALLSTAPGMDWTTMASLYGNVDDYTQQLRKLEQHAKGNLTDAAAYFVLAYHYLVTGHQEAAVQALQVVVREQPKDATAQRMLASLAPAQPAATAAAPAPAAAPAATPPQTDLVGTWLAKSGESSINLTIGDDSQFTWKASQTGQQPIELTGQIVATSDTLILENKAQGSMVGRVTSNGPDMWQFALAGAPPGDAGLNFERLKN